jgi:2-hydroxychromene-2-carboxylate isomerase
MDREISTRPAKYDEVITANERRLADVGHWGVPTLAVEGEAFFGQDRLDVVTWRLEKLGARRS